MVFLSRAALEDIGSLESYFKSRSYLIALAITSKLILAFELYSNIIILEIYSDSNEWFYATWDSFRELALWNHGSQFSPDSANSLQGESRYSFLGARRCSRSHCPRLVRPRVLTPACAWCHLSAKTGVHSSERWDRFLSSFPSLFPSLREKRPHRKRIFFVLG